MKRINNFNEFTKVNEEGGFGVGLVGGIILYLIYWVVIGRNMPFLYAGFNPFKNFSRWYKLSKVLRKYRKLINNLDDQFKDDPQIDQYYNDIKKLGHDSVGMQNQTMPGFYAHSLKDYILNNVENPGDVSVMLNEMSREINEIVPDLWESKSH